MKTIHYFIFSLLFLQRGLAIGGDTLKQPHIKVPDNPCNTFEKENIGSRRAISYTHLREGDVTWEKRVWREIDMREKQNQQFYFPLEYNPCRTSLIQALTRRIFSEDIIAFQDEQFM